MNRHPFKLLLFAFALASFLAGCGPSDSIDANAPNQEATASGQATDVREPYGNIDTTLEPADLADIGLAPGDRILVEANGRTLEALWASAYGDVPEGEGVIFANSEGRIRVARNHANAAEVLDVDVGDALAFSKASTASQ